jgi:hypothetical protein
MERPSTCGLQLQANLPFLGASMTRALLLFCAPAMFAACDVGDVPAALTPDGPGVVCEQPGVNADGHHRAGEDCLSCHAAGQQPAMASGGTLFETANGAGKGTATIIIEWAGGSAKTVTATVNANGEGAGNFYLDASELTGITYPATVKVSLCPDAERPMISKLNNAGDLACSKAGCHGNGTPKVFWRQ